MNLIPLNAAPGIPFERPSDDRVDAFAQILADRHITVSVRKSRGRDIRAACGQLIVEGQKRSAAQKLAAALLVSSLPGAARRGLPGARCRAAASPRPCPPSPQARG